MASINGNSCNRLSWREFPSTERQIDVTTHKALTRTGQHGFRGRLALGTALAGLAFSYGGRNVYAGTCSGGAGIYSCSGAAGSGAPDSTNGGLGSSLNPGTTLSVTTDPGFSINITSGSGNAFALTGNGGLTFTDANASTIQSSQGTGIDAVNFDSGALSITTTGTVSGIRGISAINFGSGLSVEAVNTSGFYGIFAQNAGSGATSVTSSGLASGGSYGIRASSSYYGTNLSVSAAGASGFYAGINVRHYGTGTLEVISSGAVAGYQAGIKTYNYGGGAQSITVSGSVAGDGSSGPAILAIGGAQATNITLNAGADLSAYYSGKAIQISTSGASTTTVNGGATVTGSLELGSGNGNVTFNGGDFSGVTVIDGGAGSDSLTVTNGAAAIAGSQLVSIENVTVGAGGAISLSGTLNTLGVTVASGGTLGGSAAINANVAVESGGTLSAGNSPGLLEIVGNLDLGLSSTTLIELGGIVPDIEYDRIDVSGGIARLMAGAVFDIDLFDGFIASLGDSFDVLTADSIVGDVNTLIFDFTGALLASGLGWETEIVTIGGGREALRLSVITTETISVSAPSSLPLFATALVGMLGLGRRRGKTA